jgi:hypothetical protein
MFLDWNGWKLARFCANQLQRRRGIDIGSLAMFIGVKKSHCGSVFFLKLHHETKF